MPDLITRVAEVPDPDSFEGRELVEMALANVPANLRDEARAVRIAGVPLALIGAVSGMACMELPEGARLVRVVVVAHA